jgi:peptidylprolyl isomerase/peptidyl-prolyl cis-trans isomerase C
MTDEIRAAHILVESRDQAEQIIGWLNEAPPQHLQQAFTEMANRYSTCGTFNRGGDLGFFARGQMHKSFEEIAFNLAPRQYNRIPVQTPFGWHVICRIE